MLRSAGSSRLFKNNLIHRLSAINLGLGNPMPDFKVADISLAAFGNREIDLAEREIACPDDATNKYADSQPLEGARIVGCIHMTVQPPFL